ncbi:MAG: DUF2393 family protein [Terracidiphilus sp.]
MNTGPDLAPAVENETRNWLPLVIAAGVVLVVAAVLVFTLERHHTGAQVAPITAPLDPYAASLPLSQMAMSYSTSLAGGKVTYLDGRIANKGTRTVTGITVQVLFRSWTKDVAQNETQPLKIIHMREPYIDVVAVSAVPLKPGDEREFRLIFDRVSPDWDGVYPEVRILHVETK